MQRLDSEERLWVMNEFRASHLRKTLGKMVDENIKYELATCVCSLESQSSPSLPKKTWSAGQRRWFSLSVLLS